MIKREIKRDRRRILRLYYYYDKSNYRINICFKKSNSLLRLNVYITFSFNVILIDFIFITYFVTSSLITTFYLIILS